MGFKGTVVGTLTTILVTPLITVVLPDMSKPDCTGIVVGPEITRLLGRGSGMVVGCTTTNGVLEISVVEPRPGGRIEAGSVVALGMIKTGMPFTVLVVPRVEGNRGGTMVVGEEIIRNGVLEIVVVIPVSPSGAPAKGIVVGLEIITGAGALVG